MGTGLLPLEGLPDLVEYMLGKTPFPVGSWACMLFKNSVDVTPDTVYGDLVECDFGGYARVTLNPSTWTTPTLVGGLIQTSYGVTPLLWTATSGATNVIYGYALIDPAVNLIRQIERFDSCDQFTITPGAQFSLLPYYQQPARVCV